MKRLTSIIILVVLLINLTLPAIAKNEANVVVSPNSEYLVGDSIVESEYQLGPGDQLEINMIVGDNALSIENDLIIGPDGKIYLPKVGEILLQGLNIPEAKIEINSKIRKIYQEKYSLSVRLKQPRKVQLYLSGSEDKPLYMGEKKFVYVYGEVPKTGRFEYIPGKRFSDYMSYAGGPTQRANLSAATVTREKHKYGVDGSDVIFNGNQSKDMEIVPGDVINVPAQFFYFTDFGSFSSMILTFVALYNTFINIR